jgi:hypothetical protein
MKIRSVLLVFFITLTILKTVSGQTNSSAIAGAWQIQDGDKQHVLIIQDGFFLHSFYKNSGKDFISSQGGTYTIENQKISAKIYFDTENKAVVGKYLNGHFSINHNTMKLSINRQGKDWERLDNGSAPLAGIWRITSRMQDGKVTPIHQTGARQTYKILSGTRFQWAAINPETKEFSGSGGGTYTFSNGKYTENIEFFSRDSSRVGASLSFEGKLENGEWHHSGLSSKGDKIYEIWSRVR